MTIGLVAGSRLFERVPNVSAPEQYAVSNKSSDGPACGHIRPDSRARELRKPLGLQGGFVKRECRSKDVGLIISVSIKVENRGGQHGVVLSSPHVPVVDAGHGGVTDDISDPGVTLLQQWNTKEWKT